MKTTIEINGKLYDAKTGKVISNTQSTDKNSGAIKNNGTVMDGVSRRKLSNPTSNLSSITQTTRITPKPQPSQPFAQDIQRPKPAKIAPKGHHSAVHSAQKSQTLNRKIVTKPVVPNKPFVHAKSTTPNTTLQSRLEQSATGRGLLIKKVPETRLARAVIAPKSALISKFGRQNSKKPQLSPHLKVQHEPITVKQNSVSHEPELKNPVNQISHEDSIKRSVFEDHLLKANSHKQKPVKKESRHKRITKKFRLSPKLVSLTAAVFAILLLGGFFAYQNIPNIGMRIAASKAGFEGKLPGSVPAGYAFEGPIQAETNNIVLTYKSRSDDRHFTIQQKPTNWSSESLLSNFLLDSQFRYQVYRDKGLTVYIYNGSNATWVDKGVWYSVISPDNTLSSEQLLELAASI